MRRLISRIRTSEVGKNIYILASGTLLSQVIILLTAPVLTRLYGPESFASLALFMAFITSLSPGISGRYEIAIAVARTQEEGALLLVIATWFTAVLSTLVLIFIFLFTEPIQFLLNTKMLDFWFYIIPGVLFLFGMNMVIRNYANCNKDYHNIGRMTIIQAITASIFAVLFGVIGLREDGLIGATILAYVIATIFIIERYKLVLKVSNLKLTKVHRELAVKYKEFPIFNAPSSVLDGVTTSLPIFFLARDYPEAIVGYFALMSRVAAAPLAFLSQAVAQVHLRKVADMVQASVPVGRYLFNITLVLSALGAIPALILFVAAQDIFTFVFGEQWREAGRLLTILIPALAIKFVVSTLSGVFSSTGNSHLAAAWKSLAFLVTLAMFLMASGRLAVSELFFMIMITECILYIFYYYLIWHAVQKPKGFV